MQKLSFSILCSALLLMLGTLQAQDVSDHFSKKNAIKINPFSFGRATFQMTYEHFMKERNSSLMLAPSVTLKETNDQTIEGWEMMGQYRFFLSHLRKDRQKTFLGVHNYGFYTGVYGLYSDYQEDYLQGYYNPVTNEYTNGNYKKEVAAAEAGALLGMQVDITKRILIDFYLGGGIRRAEVKDSYLVAHPNPDYYESYDVFDPEYKGVKPKLGLLIGITF